MKRSLRYGLIIFSLLTAILVTYSQTINYQAGIKTEQTELQGTEESNAPDTAQLSFSCSSIPPTLSFGVYHAIFFIFEISFENRYQNFNSNILAVAVTDIFFAISEIVIAPNAP